MSYLAGTMSLVALLPNQTPDRRALTQLQEQIVVTLGPDRLLVCSDDEAREIAEMCNSIGAEKAQGILHWAMSHTDNFVLDGAQAIKALAPHYTPPTDPVADSLLEAMAASAPPAR